MYTRSIDVKNNTVFLTENLGYEVDCSSLENIVFYAEQGQRAWVEREPFNGREVDYDQGLIDSLFAQALQIKDAQALLTQTPEQVLAQQVADALLYLQETDYVVIKLSEAQVLGQDITAMKAEYADVLAEREIKRQLIRENS